MRESLTIFAIALIVVLSVLLVGPYLVDWNNQRDWLAAKLSKTIGAQVKIGGSVDVKLLPRPIFRVTQVSIEGASPKDPRFSAARMDAELSINSLLQGAIDFVDAEVASPRIEVTLRSDGSLVAPSWDVSNPQKFMFKHVIVRDGAIAIKDESGKLRYALAGIDALGEAETLFGPLKASGTAQGARNPFKFRLNTGAYANGRLRVKLVADDVGPLARADIDGVVTTISTRPPKPSNGALAFQGAVTLSGSLHVADGASPVPWQAVATDVKADMKGASTTAMELRAGADGRGLVATGAALVDLGAAPSAVLKLRARQLDLDKIAVAPEVAPDTPRPKPAQWLAALQGLVDRGNLPAAFPVRLSLDYAVDAVTTGDLTLTDAAGGFEVTKDLPIKTRFAINGPDGLHIALDGATETGAGALFKGRIETATRDLPASVGWLSPLAPEAADWITRNVPVHSLSLGGTVDLSRTGFAARDMTFAVDGSTLSGSLALTSGVAGERPRLFSDITADTLDTEHFPALADVNAAVSSLDLLLGLSAKSLKVTRSGIGTVQTGPVSLHLTKVKDAIKLDDFSVTGLDGATVTATASFDADKKMRTQGHIQAANLAPLAALAREIAPNGATDALVERAALLSPLALDFKAEGMLGDDGQPTPTLATAMGTVGGTRVSGTITPEPAKLFGTSSLNALLVLDAPDTGILLRQGGLDTASPDLLGPGHMEVTARGTLDAGFDTHLSATVADANLLFDGLLDGATGTGHLKASGTNAAPLLKAVAVSGSPASAVWPWDIDTDLAWTGAQTTATKLSGRFNGAGFSGTLGYGAATEAAAAAGLSGSLTFDAVPLTGLAGLLLGAPSAAPSKAGRWWTDARFPPAPAGLPQAQLGLQIRTLALTDTQALRNATLTLRLTPGSIGFNSLSGDILGGKLGGTLTLRRDGAAASLTGQVQMTDLALAIPSLSGRLSGTLSVAGSGSSPDSLIASLAGDGALSLATAKIPRLDAGALTATAKTYDVEGATIDDGAIRETLLKALDRGPLDLGTVTAPATLAAGTLRAVGLQSQTAGFKTSSEASFDARSLAFTLRTTLVSADIPKDWKGDPPQVTVTWRGPLTQPSREIDSAAFSNGLAARAIARDQERIQLMQDDLRERAFFARRLRAIEDEQQAVRAAEKAKAAAAAAKLSETRTAKPDGTSPAAANDPLAKLLSTLPAPPAPPTRPLVRPSPNPIELKPSPQALVPSINEPNLADPTSAGRY